MPSRPTADEIIHLLDLAPLAGEGGFFRQTYAVEEPGSPSAPLTTAILYLVTPDAWSGLHRLETDELFHFYVGDPCRMVVCSSDGMVTEHRLGTAIDRGERVQVCVPGGAWQGTRLAEPEPGAYALLGTTMTPGFRQDQFTLATERDLTVFAPDVAARLRPFLAASTRNAAPF